MINYTIHIKLNIIELIYVKDKWGLGGTRHPMYHLMGLESDATSTCLLRAGLVRALPPSYVL